MEWSFDYLLAVNLFLQRDRDVLGWCHYTFPKEPNFFFIRVILLYVNLLQCAQPRLALSSLTAHNWKLYLLLLWHVLHTNVIATHTFRSPRFTFGQLSTVPQGCLHAPLRKGLKSVLSSSRWLERFPRVEWKKETNKKSKWQPPGRP